MTNHEIHMNHFLNTPNFLKKKVQILVIKSKFRFGTFASLLLMFTILSIFSVMNGVLARNDFLDYFILQSFKWYCLKILFLLPFFYNLLTCTICFFGWQPPSNISLFWRYAIFDWKKSPENGHVIFVRSLPFFDILSVITIHTLSWLTGFVLSSAFILSRCWFSRGWLSKCSLQQVSPSQFFNSATFVVF